MFLMRAAGSSTAAALLDGASADGAAAAVALTRLEAALAGAPNSDVVGAAAATPAPVPLVPKLNEGAVEVAGAVEEAVVGAEAKLLLNEKPLLAAGAVDEDELLTVEVAAVAADGRAKEKEGAVDDGVAEADREAAEDDEALRLDELSEKPPEPNSPPVTDAALGAVVAAVAGAAGVAVEPSVPKEKLGAESEAAEPNENAGAEEAGAAAEDRADAEPNRPREREGVEAVAAGAAPPNENEGAALVAAGAAAGAPKEKAAPAEAAGAAAVPNEKGAAAVDEEEEEAGAREPNEKPPVDASGAEVAGATTPNEKPPVAGAAAPKAGAVPVVAAGAAAAAG